MRTEVVAKDLAHDRVIVRTPVGIEIVFGHDTYGKVHTVTNPCGYVAREYFFDALRLAKKTFEEPDSPK